MSPDAIRERYRKLGVELPNDDAVEARVNRLLCFAAHRWPAEASVVYVADDPPGTDWPVPLCEYHAESYPQPEPDRIIPADEWEGPLGRRVRDVPPEQSTMEL